MPKVVSSVEEYWAEIDSAGEHLKLIFDLRRPHFDRVDGFQIFEPKIQSTTDWQKESSFGTQVTCIPASRLRRAC